MTFFEVSRCRFCSCTENRFLCAINLDLTRKRVGRRTITAYTADADEELVPAQEPVYK